MQKVLPSVGVMSNNQDAESIALCSVMSNDQYAATNNQ